MKRLGTSLLLCVSLWLTGSLLPVAYADEHVSEESLLKAVFIYNFAKFTRWPDDNWEDNGHLNLCTTGEDELVIALGQLSNQEIKGLPVKVLALNATVEAVDCQLLYVAGSKQDDYKEILDAIVDSPVLTISELPYFARSGGIIELYREAGRVRFIINVRNLRNTDLEISSHLLKLALVLDEEVTQ